MNGKHHEISPLGLHRCNISLYTLDGIVIHETITDCQDDMNEKFRESIFKQFTLHLNFYIEI